MFKDQVIWITGASSGIGEALAQEFTAEGAKLVLSSRRTDELERVRTEVLSRSGNPAAQIMVLTLDVLDHDAMPTALAQVLEQFGRIDMLINNAGVSQRSLFLDTELSVYEKLFAVDVLGQIALTKVVAPVMVEQGSGHLAITASVAGKVGVPYRTGYCAAKHAVMGFFDALRAEMAPHGVRVTTITPGFIRTRLAFNALMGDGKSFDQEDMNISGGMDADTCAKIIMKGFHKGKTEIAVGKGIEMHLLWIKRLFPRLLFRIAEKAGAPRVQAGESP